MQIGLDTYSFHLAFGAHGDYCPKKPMDLFRCLRLAAEIGFSGVQIDPMHLPSDEPTVLRRIRRSAEELGLFLEAGMIGLEKPDVLKALSVCAELHSPVLRTFIGFDRFDRYTDVSDSLVQARRKIERALPQIEASGVVLAIENHGDVTSTELVELIEKINNPSVAICLDIGNSLCVFEDPVQAAERMAPFSVSCHFKDYRIRMTHFGCTITGTPLGEGNIDLHAVAQVLKTAPRLQRLFVELPLPPQCGEEKEQSAVKNSLQFCKTVLN
ncbi:sugar phosphate isomerase/epimerase [candidate division KSB1 bacterium]|nr:sugar phosphate isomerase/epimerase [candidate division KSB1 bacterium]